MAKQNTSNPPPRPADRPNTVIEKGQVPKMKNPPPPPKPNE